MKHLYAMIQPVVTLVVNIVCSPAIVVGVLLEWLAHVTRADGMFGNQPHLKSARLRGSALTTNLISSTLLAERCAPVLRGNPIADSIKFFGETHDGGDFDVVARLNEYGNANANMTEVTFEASKVKKRFPRLKPLSEAVEAVVCHQAADTNPSTVVDSIANPLGDDKGVGKRRTSPATVLYQNTATSDGIVFSKLTPYQ